MESTQRYFQVFCVCVDTLRTTTKGRSKEEEESKDGGIPVLPAWHIFVWVVVRRWFRMCVNGYWSQCVLKQQNLKEPQSPKPKRTHTHFSSSDFIMHHFSPYLIYTRITTPTYTTSHPPLSTPPHTTTAKNHGPLRLGWAGPLLPLPLPL